MTWTSWMTWGEWVSFNLCRWTPPPNKGQWVRLAYHTSVTSSTNHVRPENAKRRGQVKGQWVRLAYHPSVTSSTNHVRSENAKRRGQVVHVKQASPPSFLFSHNKVTISTLF